MCLTRFVFQAVFLNFFCVEEVKTGSCLWKGMVAGDLGIPAPPHPHFPDDIYFMHFISVLLTSERI